jgi:hypothetical protein
VCPHNNLTLYASQKDPSKKYLLLCGRDYNSDGGSVDINNQATSSVDDCIDLCANTTGCVGAGWGSYQNTYTCWLKSQLSDPNNSPGWYFVIEDDS